MIFSWQASQSDRPLRVRWEPEAWRPVICLANDGQPASPADAAIPGRGEWTVTDRTELRESLKKTRRLILGKKH